MAIGDALSLLFLIKADSKQASEELSSFRKRVESETDAIKDRGKNTFTDFAKGLGLSSEKTAQLSNALPVLGSAIAGIGAASVGAAAGLFALAKTASDLGSVIKDFQEKSSLSAAAISTLKYNAEQSGISLDQLGTPLTKLTKLLSDAERGSEKAQTTLAKFGVTDFSDIEGALGKVLAKIHSTDSETTKLGLSMDAFGAKSGKVMKVVAENVEGDLNKAIDAARKFGIVLSQEEVDAADKFGDAYAKLSTQLSAISSKFALQYAPEISGAMDDISDSLSRNQKDFERWGEGIAKTLSGIRAIGSSSYWQGVASRAGNLAWASLRINPLLSVLPASYDLGGATASLVQSQATAPRVKDKLSGIDIGDAQKRFKGFDLDSSDSVEQDLAKSPKKTKEPKFKLSSEGEALVKAAGELGISPLDLATIISYETSGTFSPTIKGGKGGNYTGLIQFGKEEFKKYNVGQNKTFESQLLNSVVPFFKDRFASVGKSTFGADILDLYKTVNGGNPNVSSNASDGNGTIAQHVARMVGANRDKAINKFFGGKESNVKSGKDGFDEIGEQLKINEEIVKNREKTDARLLELWKQNGEEEKAELNNQLAKKLISETDYANRVAGIGIDNLETEKQLLDDRLKMTELNAEQRSEIEQRIDALNSEIKIASTEKSTDAIRRENEQLERQKKVSESIAKIRADLDKDAARQFYENEEQRLQNLIGSGTRPSQNLQELWNLRNNKIIADQFEEIDALNEERQQKIAEAQKETIGNVERQKELEEEINDLYDHRINLLEYETEKRKERNEQDYIGGVRGAASQKNGGGIFGDLSGDIAVMGDETISLADKSQSAAESIAASWQTVRETVGGAISGMIDAVGQGIEAWVMYGGSIGDALRQAAAAELAHIASTSAVQAIYQTALGFAALFLNPAEASAHFTAAGLFASIAVGSALLGRAIAPSQKNTASKITNQSSSASGSVSNNDSPKTINENRLDRQEITFRHIHEQKSNGEWVTKTIQEDFKRGGAIKQMIQGNVQENWT